MNPSPLPSDPELVRLVDELAEPVDAVDDEPAPCADDAHDEELYGLPALLTPIRRFAYRVADACDLASVFHHRLANAALAFAGELEPGIKVTIACAPDAP